MKPTDNQKQLILWLKIIENMGRQKSYKPILLLSIIAEIESGRINQNKINLSNSIIERFSKFYKSIGNEYARTRAHLPYYYLENDVWSTMVWKNGPLNTHPGSIESAKEKISYVKFKEDLFISIKDRNIREQVKERLFLKAEEDIKNKDPRDNEDFIVPKNISSLLERNFGKIQVNNKVPHQDEISFEFAQDSLLREFLVTRWDEITEFQDKQLKIYGGPTFGVEYNTNEVGKINILAENMNKNFLTVIDVKKGKCHENHLARLLQYIGWVRSKIANEKDVNGILIASSFPDSIRYIISELPSIRLMEYDLKFQLKPFS